MEPQDNQTPKTTTPTAEAPVPPTMPSDPMPAATTPPAAGTPAVTTPAAPAAKKSGNKMWWMVLGAVVILAVAVYFLTKK